MRSILEELFYGNICPNTDCRSHDKETKQLTGYIADHHDNLFSTLNDQQKEILEKFDDCYNELTDINEREIFSYAFKLGMLTVVFVIYDGAGITVNDKGQLILCHPAGFSFALYLAPYIVEIKFALIAFKFHRHHPM